PVTAQSTQPADASPREASAAEIVLAEGIYAQEYLGDEARALELFERARSSAELTPIASSQLRLRTAEALRRLDQPEAARRMAFELLRDASLRPDLRETGERMLRALPSPSPARLMPEDTIVYLETGDLVSLLTRSVELLRLSGAIKPPPLTNDLVDRLRRVETLGIGWHGLRGGRSAAGADVVILAFTDGRAGTTDALHALAELLIGPERLDRIERAPPSNAYRSAKPGQFWYAMDDDLYVLCTNSFAGARALGLHRGLVIGSDTAAAIASRQLNCEPGPHLKLYVDWSSIFASEGGDAGHESELWNELESTQGTLRLSGTSLEIDSLTRMLPAARGYYPVFRSEAFVGEWANWQPPRARIEIRSLFSRGAIRWGQWVQRAFSTDEAEPAWLTQLESALGIEVGRAIFERIAEVGLFQLTGAEDQPNRVGEWVLALRVDEIEKWLLDVDRCLRYLLLGGIEEAVLPMGVFETPVGVVRVLSPTRGLAGIAWLVRGSDVFIAASPEILVQFLSPGRAAANPPMAAAGESKRILIDMTQMPEGVGMIDRGPRDKTAATMTILTYERDDAMRVVITQPQFETVLPIYLNWLRESLRAPAPSRN
ncbi:MAG: hypothetical protein JNG88_14950, partial [Phycisphaerales bacterium]|nr:hypothetical protein [Phycisphaerales bacterium]